MYFLIEGELVILDVNGVDVIVKIQPKDFFGEIAMFRVGPR